MESRVLLLFCYVSADNGIQNQFRIMWPFVRLCVSTVLSGSETTNTQLTKMDPHYNLNIKRDVYSSKFVFDVGYERSRAPLIHKWKTIYHTKY